MNSQATHNWFARLVAHWLVLVGIRAIEWGNGLLELATTVGSARR
jgi:hypothetical protein